jgi:hypothetical protein
MLFFSWLYLLCITSDTLLRYPCLHSSFITNRYAQLFHSLGYVFQTLGHVLMFGILVLNVKDMLAVIPFAANSQLSANSDYASTHVCPPRITAMSQIMKVFR